MASAAALLLARPPTAALPPLSQASVWEHSAVLSDRQQQAVDIIGAVCSQRPMPAQLAAGGGGAVATPDGVTPMPPTPMSPGGSTEGAESSFVGTSFEDVTLQVGFAGE